MNFSKRKIKPFIFCSCLVLANQLISPVVFAAPQGGQIVGGTGSINQNGLTTNIKQDTQNLAIDWNSFNVSKNETVNFLQPGTSSIALNRILSNNPSQIFGQINANGQVVLVNPSGIFFGRTASVNVGGLIASGLDITPDNFMNGEYLFNSIDGTDGVVINQGLINASLGGNVGLIGQQVENEGMISAQLGSVVLAAGNEAVLTFDNDGLIGVRVSEAILQEDIGVDPALVNSGDITAEGGRILLTASVSQDVFSQAVNSGGIEQATSVVVNEDGSFTLGAGAATVNTGTIDVSATGHSDAGSAILLGETIDNSGSILADSGQGQAGFIELHANDTTELNQSAKVSAQATQSGQGGQIQILGDKVGLLDSSEVNANGVNGGGEILIGGDRQGQNDKIRNAQFVYINSDANAQASATENGNGGKVITYADDTARIYGDLSAKGGGLGGDGGFIETSGKQGFDIAKAPDVSAAVGEGGLWLIDPYNIEIVNTDPDTDSDYSTNEGSNPVSWIYTSDGLDSKIDVDTIEGALQTGDVEIVTGGSTGDGNIYFNAVLNLNGTTKDSIFNTLTLNAYGSIYFANSANIVDDSNTGDSANINLFANGTVDLRKATIDTNGGNFTVGGSGGNTPSSFNSAGLIDTTGGHSNPDGGDINITTTGTGPLTVKNLTANGFDFANDPDKNKDIYNVHGANAGAITLSSAGDISVNGNISAIGSNGNDGNGGDGSWIGGNGGAIDITSTGSSIDINGTIVNNGGDARGDFGQSANGGNAGNVTLNSQAGVGSIQLSDYIISSGGAAFGSGSVGSGGAIKLIGNVTANSVPATATSPNTFDNTLFIQGASLESGAITTTGPDGNDAYDLQVNASGSISIYSITAKGGIALDSNGHNGGDVVLTGASVTVGQIDTSGSDGNGSNRDGGAGGAIDLNAVENSGVQSVQLDGDLNSQGGLGTGTKSTTRNTSGAVTVDLESSGNPGGAVTIAYTGDFTSAVVITGSSGADTLKASDRANTWNITASDKGTLTGNVSFSAIENLVGGTANDRFDFSGGGSIADINGNGGKNTLIGQNSVNEWTLTEAQTGHVAIAGTNYIGNFSDIQVLQGGSASDTLTGRNVNNYWVIDSTNGNYVEEDVSTPTDRVEFSGMENLVGGTANDNFDFSAGGSITDINGNGGKNTLIGQNSVNEWTLTEAQTGHVAIAGTNYIGNFSDIQVLQGGSASDTLTGRNVNNYWVIDSTNGNYVEEDVSTPTDRVEFSGMEKLVGGTANDNFDFSAGGSITDINGNGGKNTLIGQNSVNEWTLTEAQTGHVAIAGTNYIGNFSDIQALQGGSASDTLTGRNVNNLWVIDSTNGNYVEEDVSTPTDRVEFSGMEKLVGGTANDRFDFSGGGSIADINGNGGKNTLIGQNSVNEWTITEAQTGHVAIAGTNYIGNFSDIQVLQGGSASDTLTGRNVNNYWVIDSTNGNYVEEDVSTPTDRVEFSGMENLVGGTANDNFDFSAGGSITDINGNGGKNTLIGQNSVNEWTLTEAQTGHVAIAGTNYIGNFSDIQVLQGGSATDTLTGRNVNNYWVIDSTNGNYVEEDVSTPTDRVEFSGMEKLVGGTANDNFDFSAGGSITDINGNGGKNTLIGQNSVNEWTLTEAQTGHVAIAGTNYIGNFSDIQVLQGGSATDTLTGRNVNNYWVIDSTNGNYVEEDVSTPTDRVEFSGMEKLVGGTANDRFDFSGGGSIADINGNGGKNTLIGQNSVNEWTITEAQTGHVAIAGTNYIGNFSDIQVLQGGSASDTLTGRNVNNYWVIDSTNGNYVEEDVSTPTDRVEFSGMEKLVGGTANDNFDFSAGGSITDINGKGGNNSLTGHNASNDFTLSAANEGKVADDIGTYVTSFTNIQTLNGSSNAAYTDTLIAFANDNTWLIDSAGGGKITDTSEPGTTLITFTEMENLTGGTGIDTFNLTTGSLSGLLDGGTGTGTSDNIKDIVKITNIDVNTVAISTTDTDYDLTITNIEDVTGNGGDTSELIANDQLNEWTITGSTGKLNGMDFQGFKSLTGGSAEDDFIGSTDDFTHTNWKLIDAGAGNDYVDVRQSVSGSTLDLSSFTLNTSIYSIEGLLGASGLILKGIDVDSTWTLTDANTGSLHYFYVDSSNNSIEAYWLFKNFSGLTGGTGIDTFDLTTGSLSGLLDGGAGSAKDIVNITNSTINTVAISTTDTANDLTITDIESITSHNGTSSELIGDSSGYSWELSGANIGNINNGAIGFTGFANLTGGTGIDTFNLTTGSLSGLLDGGAGSAKDIVNITNSTINTVAISTTDTANDLTITDIESITSHNGTSSELIGDSSGYSWELSGANIGNINNGAIGFTGFANLTGGTGIDTFNLTTGSLSGLLDGGAGSAKDIVNITNSTINTVAISATDTANDLTITDIESITSHNGTSTELIGDSSGYSWELSEANIGNINNGAIGFTGFANLTGGTGIDTFNLTTGSLSGLLDGGAGSAKDIVNITNSTINTVAISTTDTANDLTITDIESITSHNGTSSELIGDSSGYSWELSGANIGNINNGAIGFTGFANLTGGTGIDTFNLTTGSLSGLLDGGAGSAKDIVNITNSTINTVAISTTDTANDLTITDIESITSHNGTSSELIGDSSGYSWELSEANIGNINNGAIGFTGFANLTGGTGIDTFNLTTGSLSGLLDGGAGSATDIVNITNSTINTVAISTTDTANDLTITDIESINSHDGTSSELIGDSSGYSWELSGANIGNINNGAIGFTGFANLTGGTGIDTFNLTTGSLSGLLDGGAGSAKDIVNITNSTINTVAISTTDTANDLTITDIESITSHNGTSSELIGDSSGYSWELSGANIGNLNTGAIGFTGFANLTGGTGIDTFNLTTGSLSGLLDGGAGSAKDIVNITNSTINTVAISATDTANDLTITDIESINSHNGTSSELIGDSSGYSWELSGANIGNINNGAIAFTGFANLTGGTGIDTFNLTTGSLSGLLDGGAGSAKDIVNITNSTINTVAISATDTANDLTITDIESITSHNGTSSELIGDSSGYSWELSGANIGNINNGAIAFTGFANLTGGTGIDTFNLTTGSLSGLLDGGAGSAKDIVNITNSTINTVAISATDTANDLTITDIESITSHNGTSSELIGDSSGYSWELSGANIGNINNGAIAFTGFANLTGGTGIDTFNLTTGSLSGLLDGGAGSAKDIVNITNSTINTVAISATDTANDLTITDIESITSHNGASSELIGDSSGYSWELSGANIGNINNGAIGFTGFANLTGGTGIDTFNLTTGSLSGLLDGGAGSAKDIVNITNSTINTVAISTTDTANDLTITDIESINSHGGSASELVATNIDNLWTIDGIDSGNLNGLDFSRFSVLTGNDAVDTFNLTASFTGTINALGDNDVFNVGAIIHSPLTLNGGGDTGDEIIIGLTSNVDWRISGTDAGDLSFNGGSTYPMSFSDIANLTGGSGADTFNFMANVTGVVNGFAGMDTFQISATRLTLLDLRGGSDSDTLIDLTNSVNSWDITRTDGGDLNSDGTTTGIIFSEIENLTGGSGADTFDFMANVTGVVNGFAGTDTFQISATGLTLLDLRGGADSDTLIDLTNSVNSWDITSTDGGDLNSDGATTGIIFSGIENLTGANNNDDDFSIADGGSISGTVAGGTGTGSDRVINTLTATTDWLITGANAVTVSSTNFTGIETLSGSDTQTDNFYLQGANANFIINGDTNTTDTIISQLTGTTAWTIDGRNSGSVSGNTFSDIENLTGSDSEDNFTFDEAGRLIGLIDGGTGPNNPDEVTDSVDITKWTIDAYVSLLTADAAANLHISNIEKIDANASKNNTLQAAAIPDPGNIWVINAINGGTLNGMVFSGFKKLNGGAGSDTFSFQGGSASNIDAGDGTDYIDYSTSGESDVVVTLGSGSLTNNVANVEGIIGGTNYTLVGWDEDNFWVIDDLGVGIVYYMNEANIAKQVWFQKFTNLRGQSGDDTFAFDMTTSGLSGIVDGGTGHNTLSLSGSNIETVMVGVVDSAYDLTISNIADVIGSGHSVANLIGADQRNTWAISDMDAGSLNSMSFSAFANLTGNADVDIFAFASGASLTGLLDGGTGQNTPDTISDTVNITAWTSDTTVSLSTAYAGADLYITNIEQLDANSGTSNTLRAADTPDPGNTWIIDSTDGGKLNGMSFSHFTHLVGGDYIDSFQFLGGSAASIDAGAGIDYIDYSGGIDSTVTLGSGSVFNNVDNVEQIMGGNGFTLVAWDEVNTWTLTDLDEGKVYYTNSNNDLIEVAFSNFANLTGGAYADKFVFESGSALSGVLDGRDGTDTVNLSALNAVSVEVSTTDSAVADLTVIDIETISANASVSNTLIADTTSITSNAWQLDGLNSGTLNGMAFNDFSVLKGGSGVDTFTIVAGGLLGDQTNPDLDTVSGMFGQAGDDALIVTLDGSNNGFIRFVGGDGSDSANFSGSASASLTGEYTANASTGKESVIYAASNNSFRTELSAVETVQDSVTASEFSINGTDTSDTITLARDAFQVVGFSDYGLTNKTSLSVLAGTGDDTILLTEGILLSGGLVLSAETIQGNDHLITAQVLTLDTVRSTTSTLQIDVDSLAITNSDTVSANLAVHEENSLALSGLELSGTLKLIAGIDINQSVDLITAADLLLSSTGGDILLDRTGNQLSGGLTLTSPNTINLRNSVTTHLTSVQSPNLLLIDSNDHDILDSGNITAVEAIFTAGDGLITLDSAGNDFNTLSIVSAESVLVTDKDEIQLGDINMGSAAGIGTFTLNSVGVSQVDGTRFFQTPSPLNSGEQVTFNAGVGSIVLNQANNQFVGPVSLNNSGDNDVSITDIDKLEFAKSSIGSGAFTVNATGVNQSGPITQLADAAAVTINAGAGVIDLSDADNSFTGDINLNNSGANNVRFTNSKAINIASASVGGALNIISLGPDDLTQSGAISVAGAASFSVDAGRSVLLDLTDSSGTPLNHFQQALSIQTNNGGALQDVQIANDSALTLAGLNIGGNLQIIADGTVSESAAWQVEGDTNIDSNGANVTLSNALNDFNQIAFIDTQDVSLTDSNGVILGTNTDSNNISGSLSVTTLSGDILENNTSSIRVGGTTLLNAANGSGNVVLGVASNDFNIVSISKAQHVTLADTNQITLNSTTINGDINVTAGGSIEDGLNGLSVAGLTSFTTRSGENITLDNTNNQLNGLISLNAPGSLGNVVVTNSVNTALGAVAANNLSIFSAGNISQQGGFNVANETHLNANSASSGQQDIILRGVGSNSLNQLWVENAHDVIIDNSANDLTINQMNASGLIDITARNLTSLTALSAAGITFNASGNATFNASVDSTAGIEISAGGLQLNGQFAAVDDLLLTTVNGSIAQNSNLSSSAGDIVVDSAGAISMGGAMSTIASNGDIFYTAENNIDLGLLSAQDHSISLISETGAIGDSNQGSTNLRANSLIVRSATGIASEAQKLNTQVAVMDVVNTGAGSIFIDQVGNVEIVKLQATADYREIFFESDADIIVDNGSVAVNRNNGNLRMNSDHGSFFGEGTIDYSKPNITANTATFFAVNGTFGSASKPIVFDVPKTGSIYIDAETNSLLFYPEKPDDLTRTGLDISSLGVLQAISGGQLVEVESLGEIDPAIFTELKNYSSIDISIRMPRDQLYDDELTEEDQEETEKVSVAF